MGRVPIRDALAAAAKGTAWGDIGGIDWGNKGKGSITQWDHCRYKYLAHAEGYGEAYSGRELLSTSPTEMRKET